MSNRTTDNECPLCGNDPCTCEPDIDDFDEEYEDFEETEDGVEP